MESGVYHAKQKALSRTVDRSKGAKPAARPPEHLTTGRECPATAGQSLATDETLRLGQPLKQRP
jgi:hypothetical protein